MVRVFSLASGRVWCGIQRVEDWSAGLTAAERNCILGEPVKRINEYSTGRVLMRTLLAKFGVTGLSILPGRNGAPLFRKVSRVQCLTLMNTVLSPLRIVLQFQWALMCRGSCLSLSIFLR